MQLNEPQFSLILGLISQVQAGEHPNLDAVDLDATLPPTLGHWYVVFRTVV